MFRNPLTNQNLSDPFVTYDNVTGYYYLIATSSDKIEMYRSKKIGDRWYIYTSCQEIYTENQWIETKRLLILKSKTQNPFDGFEFGSKPDTSIFAIDPSTAIINGKQYICYSRVPGLSGQVLDIREMSDPLTFTDNWAEIARSTYDWELVPPYTGTGINEGAFFVRRGERLFIIYSANGCWSDDYCLSISVHSGLVRSKQ